jgi:hypothetical protein
MPSRISGRSAFIGGTPITGGISKNNKKKSDLELGNDNDSDYRRNQQPNAILAKRSQKNDDASHASSSSTAHESLWTSYERPKKLWIGLCCVAMVLIATIVAVSVIMTRNNNENRDSELTVQQKEISDIIYSISDPKVLETSSSPQAQAHQWMVFDDDLYSRPDSEDFDRDDIVQRYVLAVFYFATNGATTWRNNSWLMDHECKSPWTNIYCNDNNRVRAFSFGKNYNVFDLNQRITELWFAHTLSLDHIRFLWTARKTSFRNRAPFKHGKLNYQERERSIWIDSFCDW